MSKKTDTGIWIPPGFKLSESYDVQALATGTANKEQQMRALKYIVEDLAGAYKETEDLNSPNATYYNGGRRAVGRAIIQIVKFDLAKIKKFMEPKEKTK